MTTNITDQLRHLEDLAAMCEPGFGMGSEPFRLAREEIERLRNALRKIATWRNDCHDYDRDTGSPLRDFDEEDWIMIEHLAQRALAPHTSNADSGSRQDLKITKSFTD